MSNTTSGIQSPPAEAVANGESGNPVVRVYRRIEQMTFDGLPIRMFIDEHGICIWVAFKDIIENIGLSLNGEHDRFTYAPELWEALRLTTMKAYTPDGRGTSEIFIPHQTLNDYLYSIDLNGLPATAVGNLKTMREDLLVSINKFWTEKSKSDSLSTMDPLALRRAVLSSTVEELKRTLTFVSSAYDMEGEHADAWIDKTIIHISYAVRSLANCQKTPSSMSAIELDLYNFSLNSIRSMLEMSVRTGAADATHVVSEAMANLREVMKRPFQVVKMFAND